MGLMHSEDLSSTCGSDDAEREEETSTTNVSSFTLSYGQIRGGGREERRERGGERERERTSVYVSVS